jgi:NAD-dependent dihydropyrimidine dehydrogenase PreA subunit
MLCGVGLFAEKGRMYIVTINFDKCEACEECMKICPSKAFSLEELDGKLVAVFSIDPGKCIGCESCVAVCETEAITVQEF